MPAVGNLFRSRSRSRARTNLMVFIRPTILRSTEDARAMSARRYDFIRGEQQRQDPRAEPSIDELVREYLATVPPGALAQSEALPEEAGPEMEQAPSLEDGAEIPPAMQERPQ